jgi:hypothetical protein
MRSAQVNFGLGGVETGVCVSVVTWVRMFEHDTGGIPDFLISNSILHLESGEFSGNSWGDAQAHSDPRG